MTPERYCEGGVAPERVSEEFLEKAELRHKFRADSCLCSLDDEKKGVDGTDLTSHLGNIHEFTAICSGSSYTTFTRSVNDGKAALIRILFSEPLSSDPGGVLSHRLDTMSNSELWTQVRGRIWSTPVSGSVSIFSVAVIDTRIVTTDIAQKPKM